MQRLRMSRRCPVEHHTGWTSSISIFRRNGRQVELLTVCEHGGPGRFAIDVVKSWKKAGDTPALSNAFERPKLADSNGSSTAAVATTAIRQRGARRRILV